MNKEIINGLKERAKEMLNNDYSRKIGDEEIYTVICEWEKTLDLYNKEKEKNKELKQEITKIKSLDIYSLVETYETGQFISKDKIRKKIEELEQNVKDFVEYWSKDPRKFKKEKCTDYYKLEALKELLEE